VTGELRVRSSVGRSAIPRLTAAVLAFNGFVNLVTGIAHVFAAAYLPIDKIPEYLKLSPGKSISGIVSVFLGILLIALAKGIYERRRRSWGWALFILLVLISNNLMRGSTPQTSILSVAIVAGLLLFWRHFDVPSDRKGVFAQIFALISVLFALGYGIIGTYAMRAEFTGVQTWTDAVYYTFVTYSTLGYGDILPHTENAKLFVTSMIIIGIGSFITAMTMIVGPAIENRMKGVLRIMSRFQHIKNHVVICGYTNVSTSVIDQLQEMGVAFLIIDDRQDLAATLQQKGHDAIVGDPARKEVLEQANLRDSRAIVAAFDSDSVNTLIALTASEYRKQMADCRFRIIARVEDEGNIEKVRHVGADEVISPSTMGGRMMAKVAADPQPAASDTVKPSGPKV
jgi:voltage-gated potassium channel